MDIRVFVVIYHNWHIYNFWLLHSVWILIIYNNHSISYGSIITTDIIDSIFFEAYNQQAYVAGLIIIEKIEENLNSNYRLILHNDI